MENAYRPSRGFVISLSAVVVVLAGLLASRLVLEKRAEPARSAPARPKVKSTAPAQAPPAIVPRPREVPASELPSPYGWNLPVEAPKPMTFQVDLDLVAPLGNGAGNAAIWFRDFAKADGSRSDESGRSKISATVNGRDASVYGPDHPLLLEAGPWVDQARMRFYPDVWPVEGVSTSVPNLLHMITLAKSWVARGQSSSDGNAAKEDFRRAIRLGRLILQDDVVVITNLIGLSCIRLGAGALYDRARAEGDSVEMVKASLVMADAMGIRERYAERLTRLEAVRKAPRLALFGPVLDVSDDEFGDILAIARHERSRSLRIEAQMALFVVKTWGSRDQRGQAKQALEDLARDPDPLVADAARAYRILEGQTGVLRALLKALAAGGD